MRRRRRQTMPLRGRTATIALSLASAGALAFGGFTLGTEGGGGSPVATTTATTTTPAVTVTDQVVEVIDDTTRALEAEARVKKLETKVAKLTKQRARLVKQLRKRWQPTVDYALRLASVVYGVPYWDLRAVASCESNLNPWTVNSSSQASGLFQFLPSTWAGSWGAQKFARAGFSVFDPVANALGAAYVVSRDGSWSQWVCKP